MKYDHSHYNEQLDKIFAGLYKSDEPGVAFLVIMNNQIIAEQGYGIANLQTKEYISLITNFRIASLSKQFTAFCILLLTYQHKVSLQNELKCFFLKAPNSLGNITLHQLLTHTSGIIDYEALIPVDQNKQLTDKEVMQLTFQNNNTYFTPGSRFRYSNTGYCLLSQVIEKVSGLSFSDFIKQNIFDPLKMDHSTIYDPQDNIVNRAYGHHIEHDQWHLADQNITSATSGDGGIYTSLTDYQKWIEGIQKYTLISKEWTQKIFTPQVNIKEGIHYGLGWFIGKETDGTRCYFHSGESTGFNHIVYGNVQKQNFIIIFTNRDDQLIAKAFDEVATLMNIKISKSHAIERQPLFHWLSHVYQND